MPHTKPVLVGAAFALSFRVLFAETARAQDHAQNYARDYQGRPGESETSAPAERANGDRGAEAARHGERAKPEHFRMGALGGVGFPRPLAIEGMIKVEQMLGLGLEYSVLPTLTISDVDTTFHAVAADVRIFPFKNGFFFGARLGRHHLGATTAVTVARYGTFDESATVDTTFVNPRLGFLWTWDPGITVGIDLGVQVPLSATASNTLPAGTQVSAEVDQVTTSIGKSVLPTIDLLRLGFLL